MLFGDKKFVPFFNRPESVLEVLYSLNNFGEQGIILGKYF